MDIDWAHFTPWTALAGGVLLGVAAAAFMLLHGRILGVSGLVAGLLRRRPEGLGMRLAFVLGLAAAPWLLLWLAPGVLPAPRMETPWPLVVVAGLLVGYGTRLGSGCTSGHGVCGLARGSWRSLAATLVFMGMGMLVVLLVRHGGWL
jgi:uncharacterized membrane protein YedE/YeeE